jgi:hypothetical protein
MMTDRMFADCCYGSEFQHLPTQPCPQEMGEPQDGADDSFTGLQARLLGRFDEVVCERDRLLEYLSTLYVNALRATPKTRAVFVSFIVHSLRDVRNGTSVGEATRAFDRAQKCATCGAFSPALANDQCVECSPAFTQTRLTEEDEDTISEWCTGSKSAPPSVEAARTTRTLRG